MHAWSGQCNKNLGNAFVIVWRIGDEHSILASQQNTRLRGNGGGGNGGGGSSVSEKRKPGTSERRPAPSFTGTSRKIKRMNSNVSIRSTGSDDKDSQEGGMEGKSGKKQRKQAVIDLRRVPGVDILASHALIGYCKIIAEINRNKYVLRYRNEPRLTEKGKHDFKVRFSRRTLCIWNPFYIASILSWLSVGAHGVWTARRVGHRGCCGLTAESRCYVSVSSCKHGSKTGDVEQAVRRAAASIAGLLRPAVP